MDMKRTKIKEKAKEELAGNWKSFVFISLAIISLNVAISFLPQKLWVLSSFIQIAVGGAISFSYAAVVLQLFKTKHVEFYDGFYGFSIIAKAFIVQLTIGVFITLWGLLFIIPGIIKGYSYSQTYYIILENPEISILDAITKSREMMDGEKMNLFLLQISFIGWSILTVFTLGIGSLWLVPYINVSEGIFYLNVKEKYELMWN